MPGESQRLTFDSHSELYPTHLVSVWSEHSSKVAKEHYLQLANEDVDRAAGLATKGQRGLGKGVVTAIAEKGQNAVLPLGKPHFPTRQREWMGIEPTWRLLSRHNGFEIRGGHQIRVHSLELRW